MSVIPSNASSQQFHLLLSSILEHPYLFSSLSTSPNRKNGEDGNGRSDLTLLSPSQPSLSKSLHESDSPTVNATLVDELMSLAATDNLNKESFADAILRANCSSLVRSLGHLIDPYYFTNAEESSSLWNSHDEDIHMEGVLLKGLSINSNAHSLLCIIYCRSLADGGVEISMRRTFSSGPAKHSAWCW